MDQQIAHEFIVTFGGFIIVFLCGFGVGVIYGTKRERNWWWNEMIRRRYAEHHWEDGKIYWNADLPKTSRDPAANNVRKMTLT